MGDVSFSVELQEPISYSLYILLTGLALMAVALVVFFIFWKRYVDYRNSVSTTPRLKKKKKVVLSVLRAKYMRQIERLEKGLMENKADERTAYQELSRISRFFVHEATGLDVQNYSYAEIKALNMPGLTALVDSYYRPEFAPDTGECEQTQTENQLTRNRISPALARAIQNTKGVITAWR